MEENSNGLTSFIKKPTYFKSFNNLDFKKVSDNGTQFGKQSFRCFQKILWK